MPTLMFDTNQPGAKGTTAQATKERMKGSKGASRKTTVSAPSGMTISLRTNLKKSAKDWNRPNGPTTLGPLRICTPAQTLRSPQSRKASETMTPTTTRSASPGVIKVQPRGVAQKEVALVTAYSAATRPPRRAE